MTRQALETSYRLEPLPTGCRLGGLAVRMDLTMDLPEWTPAGPTRRGLRERWQGMLSALTRHEEGHRENAMWLAHEVHRRLSSLGEAKDCKALGKLAQRELFRVKLRFELREQTYDRRTGHGVGQGSVL
jgi:predicted secreted Zn-dependent protease